MSKKLIVAAALSLASLPAFAQFTGWGFDPTVQVQKKVALKDGSTLIIFTDGKMAMQDRSGRAISMSQGAPMETRDGSKVVMTGNELFRLDQQDPSLNHSSHSN